MENRQGNNGLTHEGASAEVKTKVAKIKIRLIGQKKGSCGAASLKMVFDYWGVSVSESEIAKIAGTSAENGTSIEGLTKAAEHFGFNATVKENASLDDLRNYIKQEIPVIVDWFSTDDGHYSVVVDIDKTHIILADSAIKRPFLYGNTRKMSCKIFLGVWFDYIGDYPEKREDMKLRLMIVVTPKESAEVKS